MTLLKRALALILSLALIPIPSLADSGYGSDAPLKGVWVSTVLNIDYPAKATTDAEALKQEALTVLNNAQAMGMNAVFLQVRPTADAIYPSAVFPWSKYLTGAQGTAPAGGFDPLAYWVEQAHARNLELHAWINPYRITKKQAGEPTHNFAALAPDHPASQHPEWVVMHTDGNLYFNPGLPEVRSLVISGVMEIVQNYDVDGIHFDDYFYPGTTFNDTAAFKQYGSGYKDIGDWRRDNVTALIRDLSAALRANPKPVEFGISPFGIWANQRTNALGSDTRGLQSYYDHYADTRKWVKEGLIDYIAPQIYWNIGYDVADYSKLLNWWCDTVRGTGTDLYIGQAAYKAGAADASSPWYGTAEIDRQLKLNATKPEVKGSIFFSYRSFKAVPQLGTLLGSAFPATVSVPMASDTTALPAVPVTLSRPAADLTTPLTQYYLNGTSDPSLPLLLNGTPVASRSEGGYFGVLVPLNPGKNTFVLTQGSRSLTRVITRGGGSGGSTATLAKNEIPADSAFPQSQEYQAPGGTVTLSCKAPVGAKVTVTVNGTTLAMTPASTKGSDTVILPTVYSCSYTLPPGSGTPRLLELGAPVYTSVYKGTTAKRTAPAGIGVIMPGAPFYAEVTKDTLNTYKTASSSDGAYYELDGGTLDAVTAMTGSYARLSSGQWVSRSGIRTTVTAERMQAALLGCEYTVGASWDTLTLRTTFSPAALADFDGSTLQLRLPVTSGSALPTLPEGALFSDPQLSAEGTGLKLSLKLNPGARLSGYYVEKAPEGLKLWMKRPLARRDADKPLTGATILLDPGHGGTDTGAIGPMGTAYPEKAVTLDIALQLKKALEAKGAAVVLTRTGDATLTLEERVSMSRQLRPDLFLSIHANSMENNVDISKIAGFSTYYKEPLAKGVADAFLQTVTQDLGRNSKGVQQRNFYVVRGTWAPSVLIETGFIPNPWEFEWLKSPQEQQRLAESLTATIVRQLTVAEQ